MKALPDILHNIADHTGTLLRLLDDPSIASDVSERLKQHMLLEEKENVVGLQELHEKQATPLTQKLLDHSFFIQRMMQEDGMSSELKRDLLNHFMEEHQSWAAEISSPSKGSQWTVGPLWPQGG